MLYSPRQLFDVGRAELTRRRWHDVCKEIYFHLAVIGTRVDPSVYIRHDAAETPTFRANNDLRAFTYCSIFRLYRPPSFDLKTRSPLMKLRISRLWSVRGCANRSLMPTRFSWCFRKTLNIILERILLIRSFERAKAKEREREGGRGGGEVLNKKRKSQLLSECLNVWVNKYL